MGLFAAASLGFYLCFFHWRNNLPMDHPVYRGVLKRFYMQPDALLAVLMGVAFKKVLSLIPLPEKARRRLAAALCAIVAATQARRRLAAALCAIVAAAQVSHNLASRDQRSNVALRIYATPSYFKATIAENNVAVRTYATSLIARLPQVSRNLSARDQRNNVAVSRNLSARDQRNNVAVRTYATSLIARLPQGSLLLTKGDLTVYPSRYVQACLGLRLDVTACLGLRPDVTVMDQEVMGYDWYIPRARERFSNVTFPPGERLRPRGKPGRYCALR
ncbi:hypothetical protein T484DRAFT_1821534 [Baffinella frigidus]|nr:hypothetical protein T484DRAFT_1821534 [Cryptophyta sp. CCMP2293]